MLFNAHRDNEGIHTILDRGRNRVFMFESKDDAIGLARMLEAQDFPIPTVEAINLAVVKEFCRKSDYDCELIPTGTTVIPPTDNGEWSRRSGITWKTQSSPN